MNRFAAALLVMGFLLLYGFLSILSSPDSMGVPPRLFTEANVEGSARFVTSSLHDSGYENSWIQFVDAKEKQVQVQTVESKITIVFRVKKKEDVGRFNPGWIAPVTFVCRGGSSDCEIGKQEKTLVGNLEVEPVIWKTKGSSKTLKTQVR